MSQCTLLSDQGDASGKVWGGAPPTACGAWGSSPCHWGCRPGDAPTLGAAVPPGQTLDALLLQPQCPELLLIPFGVLPKQMNKSGETCPNCAVSWLPNCWAPTLKQAQTTHNPVIPQVFPSKPPTPFGDQVSASWRKWGGADRKLSLLITKPQPHCPYTPIPCLLLGQKSLPDSIQGSSAFEPPILLLFCMSQDCPRDIKHPGPTLLTAMLLKS